jgi:2-(1,2-epoxy-1,2-dihydrophenyl)acetyl-CoA isomerase
MADLVRYQVADAVATLTLNRPEKLNAYTAPMGEAAVAAFRRAEGDPAVRAIVLAGAGRAFCAGVDLEALRAHQQGGGASAGPRLGEEDFLTKLPLEIAGSPKPVIAAIQGAAVGVGVTMTLPCDLRLAAEDATFAMPFVKLGLLPGLGSTHLLPRLVGAGRALDLVLTGRRVLAAEALAMGLVSRVVAPDALAGEAQETARALAACRPAVLAAAKEALAFGAESSLGQAMANERSVSAALRRG